MADVVTNFVIETARSRALSIIEEQINLAWNFKDDLDDLRKSLEMTGAFLEDAQKKQVDEAVKVWLKQLRDDVCEADELLDELAYEDLRRKVEHEMEEKVSDFFCQLTELILCLTKVRNFFSPSKNPMLFTLIMAHKLKNIKQSMADANRRASELKLQKRLAKAAPLYRGVPVDQAFAGSSELVGRVDDIQKVVGWLTGSNTQCTLSIFSILGMAGLGKTTLAKAVCKDEIVKTHFSNKIIEVCVSENFDVLRILKEMFESLIGQKCELQNTGAIVKKIQEELKGKTYLLVLDDVWDEESSNWNGLRAKLLEINSGNQSRCTILVTSRNDNIAVVKEIPQANRHHLKKLIDDECWSIIKEKAFQNSPIPSELKDIGRQVALKCTGVPLVANVIGGMMGHNKNIDEWVSIRDSPLWGSLENNEGVVRILRLSFDRMSSSALKQCFAYCSIFPKDFKIKKKQLIELWMAEGFLQQSEGSSQQAFEDIGTKYFNNLLSNSLLQDVEKDVYGCITTCKMHDLVHDLAQSISKAKVLDSKSSTANALVDVKLWHSLFAIRIESLDLLSKFKSLRVLNFSGSSIVSLPYAIENLKLLRYFDISSTYIRELPKSITNLYYLQTLRLLNCDLLNKLPSGMKSLVRLRHLHIDSRSHFPGRDISCLTSLHTLPIFDVGTERRCGIGVLGPLTRLRGELAVFNLQNVRNNEEAREAKLWEKEKIHKLKFHWQYAASYRNDEEVLEGLKPHSYLKSLTIKNYSGGNYPSWLARKSSVSGPSVCFQLINLVELKLSMCRNVKNLSTLGLYPNLKFLEIEGLQNVRSIGKEFYVDDNWCDGGDDKNNSATQFFPALETFSLQYMEELEDWLIEEEPIFPVFPSLKELRIRCCAKLRRVPMMSRFSSLEMLEIDTCNQLCWIRELEEVEEDRVLSSTLKILRIERCMELRSIPGIKGGISSLQKLHVSECRQLSRIGETLLASSCLREVRISKCPKLRCISLNGGSQSLTHLYLHGCHKLGEIVGGLSKSTRLQTLSIEGCRYLTSISTSSLDGFSFLSTLEIESCSLLRSLPSGLQTCTSLQKLSIVHCSNVESFPAAESLGYLTRLKELYLGPFSKELDEFPFLSCIHNPLSSPVNLELYGWKKLSSLPYQLQHLTALKELSICNFDGVKTFPEWLGNFSSLQKLSIINCSNVKSFPVGKSLGYLTCLKKLKLGPFSKELEEFPLFSSIHNLDTCLEILELEGWEKLSSLPHQLQHLTALKKLSIWKFGGLKALPEWLGNLSSLEELYIEDCKNLEQVPSEEAMQRLSNLQKIRVRFCPGIERKHRKLRILEIDHSFCVGSSSDNED